MKAKRRSLSNKPIEVGSALFWQRIQEGGFILFSALAAFLLVALLSYNQADPGWSHASSHSEIQNAAGQAGAWFADLCFYLFGYISYLIPTMIGYGSFKLFQTRERFGYFYRILWVLRIIGFGLAVLSGCGLASLHFSGWDKGMPVSAGGICGQLLSTELSPVLGYLGSSLSLIAVFLTGITLATGLSWFGLLDFSSKAVFLKWMNQRPQFSDYWKKLKQIFFDGRLKELINWRSKNKENDKASKILPKVNSFKKEPTLGAEERLSTLQTLGSGFRSVKSIEKPEKWAVKNKNVAEPKYPIENRSDSVLPPVEILEGPRLEDAPEKMSAQDLEILSREVEMRLSEFGVQASVVAVYPGPVITRFELELAAGLKVSKISGLAKDLARALSVTRVRVVEVIPGKSVVGLEIPNQFRELVRLREIFESSEYLESSSPLTLALGKDTEGNPQVVNLAKMPHLLVAGTTGSGKSVGINVMLLSLLYKATPEDVRLILIDPKMLELSIYDGIPHLLTPVVTDMKDAANALRWCVAEMERRYQLMAALGVRNLIGFNRKVMEAESANEPLIDPLWRPETGGEPETLSRLPYVVVIIDEFADMMMVVGKKVEELIARIAQKARAAGIHLILATQRPSVDVITGLIKANVPTRIAFQVSSRIDSRTILDQQGAEQLLGHGDMLYLAPGSGIPIRIHGAFVSDEEVHAVVKALKATGEPDYAIDVLKSSNYSATSWSLGGDEEDGNGEQDDLYDTAVQIIIETRRASISHLQRRLKIGYNRAARLIETMESAGIVSTMQQNGNREVLVGQSLE